MTLPTDNTFIERPDEKILYQNKLFFGAYLNMAQHNAYLIIKDISEQFGLDISTLQENQLESADLIKKLKGKGGRPKNSVQMTNALVRRLPFLEAMKAPEESTYKAGTEKEKEVIHAKEIQSGEVGKILTTAFEFMGQLRNFYSHYHHEDVDFKDFSVIEIIFDNAIKRAIKRIPDVNEENTNHLLNAPTYAMYKDGKLTNLGLTFFICLFLERKYAYLFLMQLEHFKGQNDFVYSNRRCFTDLSCNLPKPKLGSSEIEMDILGELARCPKELFYRLSEEDKNKFFAEQKETEDEIPPPIMKRKDDRFASFALRYLEEKRLNKMRFQIHLGKVRRIGEKHQYDKTIAGVEAERVIMENLRTFAKLSETNTEKTPEHWRVFNRDTNKKDLIRTEIEQFRPRHQITGNRIALKFLTEERNSVFPDLKFDNNQTKLQALDTPDAILSTYELQNLVMYDQLHKEGAIEKDVETFIADYILNFRKFCEAVDKGEVTPVADADFIKVVKASGKSKPEYSEAQLVELKNRQQSLKGILTNYGLQIQQLPDNLREYLLGYAPVNYKREALRILETKFSETLKLRTDSQKGFGPKVGEMATFLARDINHLKPPREWKDSKVRLNDEQYDNLQAAISQFSGQIPQIEALFDELELTKSYSRSRAENEALQALMHPFLFRIKLQDSANQGGIHIFYQRYLNKKADWLQGLMLLLKQEPYGDFGPFNNFPEGYQNISLPEFTKKFDYVLRIDKKLNRKKQYLFSDKEKTQKSAIFLPRGLFNAPIMEALFFKKNIEVEPDDSLVMAMSKYKPDSQSFYNFERIYTLKGRDEAPDTLYTGDANQIGAQMQVLKKEIEQMQSKRKAMSLPADWWETYSQKNKGKKKKEELTSIQKTAQNLEYQINDLKKFRRSVMTNEQTLRYRQTNDRVLWLIVKNYFEDIDSHFNIDISEWELHNVGFEIKEKNVLNTKIDLSFPLYGYTIHTKQSEGENVPVHESDHLTIKRYGEFRYVLKDRRLWSEKVHQDGNIEKTGILRYYSPDTPIAWSILKRELDTYDGEDRHKLMNHIHAFEYDMYTMHEEKMERESGAKIINHLKQLEAVHNYIAQIDKPNHLMINELRSKFMHNQIPFNAWLENELKNTPKGSKVKQLLDIATKAYHNIITQINQ